MRQGRAAMRLKVKADPRWDQREPQTDHGLTESDDIVEILLEIGGRAG